MAENRTGARVISITVRVRAGNGKESDVRRAG
jgi:hypothetical protein